MLKAIDVNETKDYMLSGDKENPTVFVIGVITNRDKIRLFGDAISGGGGIDMGKLLERAPDILRAGVKKVKNFGGKDIDVIDNAFIDQLPFDAVSELLGKVAEFNFLSESERKN